MAVRPRVAGSKSAMPARPNYNQIHKKPLPLNIFPLPPLAPHNPICLLHIAYVYLSQLFFPPSSHSFNLVDGFFYLDSNSVHVTDHTQARILWERGFFGKGSLSRSEPTWLDREKKRLGLAEKDTSEEWRQKRRQERQRMKMGRARQQQEDIETRLAEEQVSTAVPSDVGEVKDPPEMPTTSPLFEEATEVTSDQLENLETPSPTSAAIKDETPPQDFSAEIPEPVGAVLEDSSVDLQNAEHLQLCAEEAFFLVYALGILCVREPIDGKPIPTAELLSIFRSHSYFPPVTPDGLVPYDPFMVSYVAYHHFRSLGWVVRPGIKFGVDWLLYLRGPPFHHAEFAVVILPAFRDGYWWEDSRKAETMKRERRDWWWLHCAQRVQAHVRKGLVVCWVEIPRPEDVTKIQLPDEERDAAETKGIDIAEAVGIEDIIKRYKVREFVIKRWIPNRSRD